ncbi:hypothetical protein KKB58_02010, partial [Patescibacteria group bacterium]|nr:hypothetical protein [Patescibacteria group bacterium]
RKKAKAKQETLKENKNETMPDSVVEKIIDLKNKGYEEYPEPNENFLAYRKNNKKTNKIEFVYINKKTGESRSYSESGQRPNNLYGLK